MAAIRLRGDRRQPVGFEALARWRHDGPPVAPDVFVPLVAQAGLMPVLTAHMLDISCAQVAAWSAELGHDDLRIGVNISPTCIADTAPPDRVAAQLERQASDRANSFSRSPEEALLNDLSTAAEVTRRLCDLGVRLSLDDLGTGYSSLLHLPGIALHSMKIDRGFIQDVDIDPISTSVRHSPAPCAADLDVVVVVVVERPEQAQMLVQSGAVFAQG